MAKLFSLAMPNFASVDTVHHDDVRHCFRCTQPLATLTASPRQRLCTYKEQTPVQLSTRMRAHVHLIAASPPMCNTAVQCAECEHACFCPQIELAALFTEHKIRQTHLAQFAHRL